MRTPFRACLAAVVLAVLLPVAGMTAEAPLDPLRGLEYRLLGPAAGGRVSRVAGVPGDPLTCWAAVSAGGVWKSTNGGLDWKPVFDGQPVSSIGSIAVAPSDPNVVWVGSGEANIRGNVAEGNGIYRSTDAGKTWAHVWKAEGQIGTIAVHPKDPDTAWAAVLGSPFGPGRERGVYRSSDGGATWKQVLFVDPDTGASDVALDPSNPRILFAGTWQARRTPWSLTSGGPGGGLWRSGDGGDTWVRLTKGLPGKAWGKVGVAVAPSDPRRVYALIEAEEGGLFRSDDGGESWERVNASRGLRQRAWYYSTMTVDPRNPDVVWFPQVRMLKTLDGGRTVRTVKGGGWDHHDLWLDPTDPRRVLVASDAGISVSRDGGESWVRPPLPISQFYRIAVDARTPYRVMGSLQDWGTVSGPSSSLHRGGIFRSDWFPVGGGEAGHLAPDPSDPDVVWAGEYMGYLSRWDGRTGQAPHVGILPDNGSGRPPSELAYRFQWTAPILVSRHDPRVVYHAANVLFRTDDAGRSWRAISPDLTRNDREKQGWSGGPITGDITGVETFGTIFALAESPLDPAMLWAGSDDGRVHVTADGGATWTDVTPPGMPQWGTVNAIEASRFDRGTVWVVADAHRLDDEAPYLWRTTDAGRTWTRLERGLDREVYLHVVREDAGQRGLLYLGTERGVMLSRDAGATWAPLQLNLPTVAVADLVVAGDDLVVATIGRSAWVLDDLTPVRAMTAEVAARPVHLFPPRPAVRWRLAAAPHDQEQGATKNPPAAIFDFHLAAEPEGEAALEVVDADGRLVRRLRSVLEPQYTTPDHPDWDPEGKLEPELTVKAGLNRVGWDLTYGGARWVAGTRSDVGAPGRGLLVAPGEYVVRLTVAGTSVTQPLSVRPDPRGTASAADLQAQTAFLLGVRDTMSGIADMVAALRDARAQLDDRVEHLAADPSAAEVVAEARRIAAALTAVERAIHNPDAEVGYDILAGRDGGAKLLSRYGWLFGASLDHDGPPTQGMREVAAELDAQLAARRAELDRLLGPDLEDLNRLAGPRFGVRPAAPAASR